MVLFSPETFLLPVPGHRRPEVIDQHHAHHTKDKEKGTQRSNMSSEPRDNTIVTRLDDALKEVIQLSQETRKNKKP